MGTSSKRIFTKTMSQRNLQAQLKTAQANAQPKFLIELAKPTQEKNCFKNISNASKKNKTPDTQARQKSTRQMTVTDDIKMVVTHDRQERQPITAVLQKWRFSASYDSEVVNQNLVLRMKFCGEKRHLRKAANRYRKFY